MNRAICTVIILTLSAIALYAVWTKETKMLNDWKFWTFIIGVISICGGIPGIYSFFQHSEIRGKIISRYNNLNNDQTQTMFIFKLSLYSKNKPFNIKQIKCQIEDTEGNRFDSIAVNNTLIYFTNKKLDKVDSAGVQKYIDKPQTFLVDGKEFLNNYSFIPKNENISGYLYFVFDQNLDGKIRSTSFIFESFDNKIQQINFPESNIKSVELLHDDTIWRDLSDEELTRLYDNQ